MVTLSRRLMQGKSVSRINGETVTTGLLKEAASILIDIHGQHEHQSLLYKKNHLDLTDAYAKDLIQGREGTDGKGLSGIPVLSEKACRVAER